MVETQQIHDPNYVLDDRGKAHYLFDKKNADGKIQKTFRTHSKHSNSESIDTPSTSRKTTTSSTRKRKAVEPVPTETKKQPAKASSSRRRRRRFQDSGSDSGEDESGFDDDFSGNFSSRSIQDMDASKRRSKRQRRPTAAAVEGMSEGGLSSLYFDPPASDTENDPTCPLPGFIDPITLEQVIKPAISKYGHVMG